MITEFRSARTFLVLLCVSCPGVAAADDFAPLVARVPKSTNALVLIDASKAFSSELAMREGWREDYAKSYSTAPMSLPPGAEQFVWAGELDLEYLSPTWQVAVMNLSKDPPMAAIAKSVGGKTDSVGGLEAVSTPRGAMIIRFGPREFGIIKPGSRQKAARWIRDAAAGPTSNLSPYLESAAADATRDGSDLTMAFDLTDALDRESVRKALAGSAALREASLNPDQVADLLVGIRGVTLAVHFTDKAHGKLDVDFRDSVDLLGETAKPLLIEVLSEAGAMLDELPEWELTLGDKQFSVEGELTKSGLTRVLSFLEVDTTAVDDKQRTAPETNTDGDDVSSSHTAQSTRDYYKEVQKYLRDLRLERGASSYYTIAVWFEKYAGRIERLPILDVDSEMLDYSESVIGHLRGAADSIRAGGIRTGAREAQVRPGDYGSQGYPVFSGSANYAASQRQGVEEDRRAIRAEERAKSSLDARGHMTAVQNETVAIRRSMTEKYGMEF